MTQITWALKEWAIAVNTLLSGDLILLIRKGGIREASPFFELPSDRAILFPTYEHASIAAIREDFHQYWIQKPVPVISSELRLPGWVEITHQVPLNSISVIDTLHPFHIWTDAWLTERLTWKPERPAYALLVRVHRFVEPLSVLYQTAHTGCRSWITFDSGTVCLPSSHPVLTADTYDERVEQILKAMSVIA